MKRTIRRAKNVYHTETKGIDSDVFELSIVGSTKDGNDVKLIGEMPFHFIPYLIRNIKKVWQDERIRRISQINEIDSSLSIESK